MLASAQMGREVQQNPHLPVFPLALPCHTSNSIPGGVRPHLVGLPDRRFSRKPGIRCRNRRGLIRNCQQMILHQQVLEPLNRTLLLLVRRENRLRTQELSQRRCDPAISRACMRTDIIRCPQERLQVLQRVHRRPLLHRPDDLRVRGTALPADNLSDQLHLGLR